MVFKLIVAAVATAMGSWMGQYLRTAATVPDEAPQPPALGPEQVLPSFLLALFLVRRWAAGGVGTVLLGFNLGVFWSFLLGNEQSRRWLRRAHKG